MKVLEVDKERKTIIYGNGDNRVAVHNNRIILHCGFLNPVEKKEAYKSYNSIFNEKYNQKTI